MEMKSLRRRESAAVVRTLEGLIHKNKTFIYIYAPSLPLKASQRAREMSKNPHHMGARFREDPEWPRAFRATVTADERREKLYGVCHRAGFAQRHQLDGS